VAELGKLAPKDGEEDRARRQAHHHDAARRSRAICARRRRPSAARHSPVSALSGAVRRLERRAAQCSGAGRSGGRGARPRDQSRSKRPASTLRAALAAPISTRAELERIEERLFALRAAARKYSTFPSTRCRAGREICRPIVPR
jgi:DNA repair protein RecN (Recombination protein N)